MADRAGEVPEDRDQPGGRRARGCPPGGRCGLYELALRVLATTLAERKGHDEWAQALLDEAHAAGLPIAIPAGPLAQAWRSGLHQVHLARTLHVANVTVPALEPNAKVACILCGQRGTPDPVCASVALDARRRDQTVITSDPADLRHLDAHVRNVERSAQSCVSGRSSPCVRQMVTERPRLRDLYCAADSRRIAGRRDSPAHLEMPGRGPRCPPRTAGRSEVSRAPLTWGRRGSGHC